MNIIELNEKDYETLVLRPFSKFEEAEFIKYNAHKVKEVKYFVFNNGKNRFAFVGGIKDGILKFPFSASFECLSEISKNNRISHYYETVESLVNWAKNNNIETIKITTPPNYYAQEHITKFINALFINDFKIQDIDVNFEYYLKNFDDKYIENLDIKARQNLKKSLKMNLSFEKTEDFEFVYDVIKQNRESKGYPLWMSLEDVKNTSKIIPTDLFLIKDEFGKPITSAICHRITNDILRVVYWGNIPNSDYLCPMNFIAYQTFKWYKENSEIKIIDIGPSTEDSKANFGLCDFKESIGCSCSEKKVFIKNL